MKNSSISINGIMLITTIVLYGVPIVVGQFLDSLIH